MSYSSIILSLLNRPKICIAAADSAIVSNVLAALQSIIIIPNSCSFSYRSCLFKLVSYHNLNAVQKFRLKQRFHKTH